jgi:uncharacterized protein YfaS (alpha-2-macroglobulin family)
MSGKVWINLGLVVLIITLVAGLFAMIQHYEDLPNRLSQHETIVLGQDRLTPGSQAAVRVVVQDTKDGSPLAGAVVSAVLKPNEGGEERLLYSGVTGPSGSADVVFRVPSNLEGGHTLRIETRSVHGSDTVERPVNLQREYRVLLTTDKPLYQPGQIIHMRALALGAFDRIPAAGQTLDITVADGKGNKVFRRIIKLSDYGVGAADFQLADEVNTGPYKITAALGKTASEKTVTVAHYVLPKFAVRLHTDRPYYRPGDRVTGSLDAAYFFGKPVAGGSVRLEGYTFDVDRTVTFTLEGETDEEGRFNFEFRLPQYLAGSELDGGRARYTLAASVTDGTEHVEEASLSLPVSGSSLVIEAVPEGGKLRMGVENILYVLVAYPDGAPAAADLIVRFEGADEEVRLNTGQYGLGEVRYTPQGSLYGVTIVARDRSGAQAERRFDFETQWSQESVLLRPDRPVYRVGETMNLTVLTSAPQGTIYVDLVREGQTVSTRSVDVQEGRAELAVDLSPDLYGTLVMHAYKVMSGGSITRDTRLVVVDQAEDLRVSLSTALRQYRPGENAGLAVQVRDGQGIGVQSALGLAVVDEAVFALAEQDPGFAKIYFLLEEQIMTPRYDLHGFSVPDLVRGIPESSPGLEKAVSAAAHASLSEAAPGGQVFTLMANSHDDAVHRVREQQRAFFDLLAQGLLLAFVLLPVILFLTVFGWVKREYVLGRSLLLMLGLALLPLLILIAWPMQWAPRFALLERLDYVVMELGYLPEGVILGIAIAGLAGMIGLLVVAIVRRSPAVGWAPGLLILSVIAMIGLDITSSQSSFMMESWYLLGALAAFVLLPLSFLLLFSGFAMSKQVWGALAALPVFLFLIIGIFPVVQMISYAGQTGMVALNAAPQAPVMAGRVMVEEAAMAPGIMLQEKAVDMNPAPAPGQSPSPEPPRLRQYFPETMLWLADAVTDESGRMNLQMPLADSITTWRITALASSQEGQLGSAAVPLRVFQDFFIDLNLPLSLTVGDEIAVPVGIFNYLEEPQTVRLELEPSPWFELLDPAEKSVEIAANDISVAYFRIRVKAFGLQPFKVTAWGSSLSDAILKEVRVFPNGKQIHQNQSDRLQPGEPVETLVRIPEDAVAGTQTLTVRIYPGVLSQLVEGLDSILRMPYGCFEQTSSATYPNVLVLDYLKNSGLSSPEVQLKAEEYINLGYQRLVTFEVASSGGFSLFGDAPADRMLTAYGLQEFADMSRVHPVDEALLRRAADWLLKGQRPDGSWDNDRGLVHEGSWQALGNDRLPVTAYIVWSLVESGFENEPGTRKGLEYVREHLSDARDPYVLALVANALVAADLSVGFELSPATLSALERLAAQAGPDGSFQSQVATFMGSEGLTGSIETTALAALALLRAEEHLPVANQALGYLIRSKDSFGTWNSTQATVLSLKALLQTVQRGGERSRATITVSLNDGQTRTLEVTPENFDVVQMVSFDDIPLGRDNTVAIRMDGQGSLAYAVTSSFYLPWERLSRYADLLPDSELVTIDVQYDRTELQVNDTVQVDVTASLNRPGARAESAIIDLGLPPGFSVMTADLDALVTRNQDTLPGSARIERYELTGRQIIVYLTNLQEGQPLSFSYRLQARFPVTVRTPGSQVYDYYNPDVNGLAAPQRLVVK